MVTLLLRKFSIISFAELLHLRQLCVLRILHLQAFFPYWPLIARSYAQGVSTQEGLCEVRGHREIHQANIQFAW